MYLNMKEINNQLIRFGVPHILGTLGYFESELVEGDSIKYGWLILHWVTSFTLHSLRTSKLLSLYHYQNGWMDFSPLWKHLQFRILVMWEPLSNFIIRIWIQIKSSSRFHKNSGTWLNLGFRRWNTSNKMPVSFLNVRELIREGY